MDQIYRIKQQLHIEGVAIADIAQQVTTPFYVYSQSKILEQYQKFVTGMKKLNPLVCYALKANSNLAILELLAREGAGADVVSKGEMERALKAGIRPEKIVFSGVGKQDDEISFALLQKIKCFNVESISELDSIRKIAQELQLCAPVSLRINPDVDAKTHAKISTGKAEDKFGIPFNQAEKLYLEIANDPSFKIVGVDMHIGSQITSEEPFEQAFNLLQQFVLGLKEQGIILEHIDIGGGLGVSYCRGQEVLLLEKYIAIIEKYLEPLQLDLICEPGRYLVAESGLLVTSVIYSKQAEKKSFLIVDAGMNDFMRPALYDAWHDILLVDDSLSSQDLFLTDVVGPVCETGDFLAQSRSLPHLPSGSLLAVACVGAYGAVMSHMYNSRALIPEILVNEKQFAIIRRRVELEETLAWEQRPDWL